MLNRLTPDKLTTLFSVIAGVSEVLIEFEFLDKKTGGAIFGVSLVLWGAFTNKLSRKMDRLLISSVTNTEHTREMEEFLEKNTDFRVKTTPDQISLSEIDTDFI